MIAFVVLIFDFFISASHLPARARARRGRVKFIYFKPLFVIHTLAIVCSKVCVWTTNSRRDTAMLLTGDAHSAHGDGQRRGAP